MPTCRVDGDVVLHYSDDGAGPAVLFLHGWACDGTDWNWLAADLAVDHRVIVLDQRGHGRSSAASQFGAKTLAADAAALLDHLSIEQAVVVGHSMGTVVGSALAVERPDLVTALILSDPVYGQQEDVIDPVVHAMRSQPLETAAAIFSQFYVDSTPSWLKFWHRRRLLGHSQTTIVEAFCSLYDGPDAIGLRTIGETYLAQRKCPILVVYGSFSAHIAEWERSLPHSTQDRVDVWSDVGHFPHQERPEDFALLCRQWLSSLSA